jgi:hypothetical protein
MRCSMIRGSVVAMAVSVVLSSCNSTDAVSAAKALLNPVPPLAKTDLKTCATSPPQFEWIFEGACDKIDLNPAGAPFALQLYQRIRVTGQIGKTDLKRPARVVIVDALDNGDIEPYQSQAFPSWPYPKQAVIYAVAINESYHVIKPIVVSGKPVLEYVITDFNGFPGTRCSSAVLTFGRNMPVWKPLPVSAKPKGYTLTLKQYTAPAGFKLLPQTPLYFVVYCRRH